MGVIVSATSSFKTVEPGSYVARCYAVIDLGTQESVWEGKPRKAHKLLIQWELPTELIEDGEHEGKPHSSSKRYTLSLHEKAALRADLKNWRGRDFTAEELKKFDVANLLGATCLLNIVKDDKDYSVVGSISRLPKGMDCPPPVNTPRWFSLAQFDAEVFASLSDKLKATIGASDEYKALDRLNNEFTFWNL